MSSIYVSGPMAGVPDLNEPAFRRAAERLLDIGHTVVVPHDIAAHEHDGSCPTSYAANPNGHSAACYLRTDLQQMLFCDAIVLLPGWEGSVGARMELSVAAACGMRVYFADERGVVRP